MKSCVIIKEQREYITIKLAQCLQVDKSVSNAGIDQSSK
jgi:hypothetical protein